MKKTYLTLLTLALWLMPLTGETKAAKARWPKSIGDCSNYQAKYCKNLLCLCYVGTNNPKDNVDPININAVEACNARYLTCVASGEENIELSPERGSTRVYADDVKPEKTSKVEQ